MTIKEFICSDDELSHLDFRTAYQTILTLISKDLISIDDFAALLPSCSSVDVCSQKDTFKNFNWL